VRIAPSTAADVRVVNGRQVVFWPCAHCRLGLNTPYENVGLAIQCPGCQESVMVPDPIGAHHRQGRPSARGAEDREPDYRLPRRRKSAVGLIVALTLSLLVIVGGLVGLLIWQPWANKTLSAEQLRFLPDESQVVATIDVQGLLASEVYHKVDEAFLKRGGKRLTDIEKDFKSWVGMGWSDLERVTVGGKMSSQQGVIVVKTRKAVDARQILTRLNQQKDFDEISVDGFKIFKHRNQALQDKHPSFCVVEPTLVVFSVDLETLRRVLSRREAAVVSTDLQPVMNQTDFSRTIALAMGKLPAGLPAGKDPSNPFAGFEGKLQGISLEITLGGAIDIKVSALCVDSKTAKELNDTLTSMRTLANNLNLPPEAKKILDTMQFSYSGATFSARVSLDPDTVINLVEKGVDQYLGRLPPGRRN
jgi:hypothetical protein